jgi:phosphohistidine phosphatase
VKPESVPSKNGTRMELVLWRHAEAEPGEQNLERRLTSKGQKQAAWVASWLQQRLPAKFAVFTSPAEPARQTAAALGVEPRVCARLGPGTSAADVLAAVDWPNRRGAVAVIVGHQPALGRVAAQLVAGAELDVSIKKGGLWWIARRDKAGKTEVVVRAVTSPDFL